MKLFEEYKIKNMTLKNRIVMPPMCMYSADHQGMAKEFHRMHYGERAIGGVGLIILEATAVTPNGRISDNDLGAWEDGQIEGLKTVADSCKAYGAKVAVQINHAGRKCGAREEALVAPSPLRFSEEYPNPRELSKEEIKGIISSFKEAARRVHEAGFDALEVHGAHGYLISEFLSPLSNHREDEYGGSLENRIRFLKEVLEAIRTVWPEEKPILLRVSAYDYAEGGMEPEQMVQIINSIKPYIDAVHVSSGAVVPVIPNTFPGYQIAFSEIIRKQCDIPTITVGLITRDEMVEEILANDRADLVALGRELLRNPYWVLHTAYKNKVPMDFPRQYKRAFM